MPKKVLFIVDYAKKHYFKEERGEVKDKFFETEEGMFLKQSLKDAFRATNVSGDIEYHITYAYPKVPQILKDNKKAERIAYKKPTVSQYKEYKDALITNIITYSPDIIIPFGEGGTKALIGPGGISTLRGMPKEVEINYTETTSYKFWVLPIYSPAYALVNPNVFGYVSQDLLKLGDFLNQGEEAFEAKEKSYRIVTNNFEEVANIFKEAFTHGKTVDDPIAWDYETSSLKAEMAGSKILTVSLAWKGNPGLTIPINHWEQPWSPEEQVKINKLLALFLGSDLWKVGHNVQFDMRQSKFLIDKDLEFKNTLDTMVGYYLAVSQEEKVSFGLKTVAYEFTNQGGYEKPLDDYKDWFLKFLTENEKVRLEKREPISNEDYMDWLSDEDRKIADKWANELLDKYGQASLVRNPADGEKFSYEWIPYDILSRYAGGDVDVTLQIHHGLLEKYFSKKPKLYKLYTEHYPELLDTLSDIEVFGIQIDRNRMNEMMTAFDKEQNRLMELIKTNEYVLKVEEYKEEQYEAGLEEKAKAPADRDKELYKQYTKYRKPEDRKFNPSSKLDMQMALFGFTGINPPAEDKFLNKDGKDGLKSGKLGESDLTYIHYSTGKEVIDWLSKNYPDLELVNLLQEYNKLTKLLSTYTQGLLDMTDDKDVLHGNLKATGTATSRLASSGPNL